MLRPGAESELGEKSGIELLGRDARQPERSAAGLPLELRQQEAEAEPCESATGAPCREDLATAVAGGRAEDQAGLQSLGRVKAEGAQALALLLERRQIALPAARAAQQAAVKTLGEERWSAILSDLKRVAQALKE